MDEFLSDFLVECNENLAKIDQDLVSLENNPQNVDVLKNIFRAIHSVKGSCGMFGFQRLEHVAHAAEDILSQMRDGKLPVTSAVVSPVLKAIDLIKAMLLEIEANKVEPAGDDSALIAQLNSLLVAADATARPPEVASEPKVQEPQAIATITPQEKKQSLADQTLRVHIDVLDGLMNLVGELVPIRNQLLRLVAVEGETKYLAASQQLNRVTSGLQEAVMKTRMQPVGSNWGKLPRIVRDLEQSTGKKVELILKGQDTEIDRQVLQAIHDPLIHCVRNSVDHGIEDVEIRRKAGKREQGTICLNAFHGGGHIIIEVSDDGGGIDTEVIGKKAVEKGLVTAEALKVMSQRQILNLIFEPGFSTAKKVTEVSGRGVGMDVVRTNIEKIGGSVDLETTLGKGTTIKIKIPLTLAIISALIVKAGKEAMFAIPQVGVLELVRISSTNSHLVEEIHGSRVSRLRDKLIPIVDLPALLGMTEPRHEEYSVVVASAGNQEFGFLVDEIFDTQEIVVKPVGKILRDVNLFAGSTILGDGSVVIILDTLRIAARAGLMNTTEKNTEQEIAEKNESKGAEKITFLVFNGGTEAPMAVPLSLVSRLEEFDWAAIEKVNGSFVVQYRNALVPLLMCKNASIERLQGNPKASAIIFSDGKRTMGVLVKEITDIVETELVIEKTDGNPEVLGAGIVDGAATEILDVYHFLRTAFPGWFQGPDTGNREGGKRILVVDDSQFFRGLLRPLLESRGYKVQLAEDGRAAYDKLSAGEIFDLIVSDIEMPICTGIEFAKKVREEVRWKNIPMLALTSLTGAENINIGRQAGFDDYLIKFDQEQLLQSIQKHLRGRNELRS